MYIEHSSHGSIENSNEDKKRLLRAFHKEDFLVLADQLNEKVLRLNPSFTGKMR